MNNLEDETTLLSTLRKKLLKSKLVEIFLKEKNPIKVFMSINRPTWFKVMVIFINILLSSLSFVVFYAEGKEFSQIFPLYLFTNLFLKFCSLFYPRIFIYIDVLSFYCLLMISIINNIVNVTKSCYLEIISMRIFQYSIFLLFIFLNFLFRNNKSKKLIILIPILLLILPLGFCQIYKFNFDTLLLLLTVYSQLFNSLFNFFAINCITSNMDLIISLFLLSSANRSLLIYYPK